MKITPASASSSEPHTVTLQASQKRLIHITAARILTYHHLPSYLLTSILTFLVLPIKDF